jgi:glutamyl-tRNA synthetase
MPLLVGADGAALSKRLGSLSVSEMRDQGYEPLAITSHLGKIGTSDALEVAQSLEALGTGFSFDKMGRSPARYDTDDLDRLNAQALHAMSYSTARARLEALGCDLGDTVWVALRPNLDRFDDIASLSLMVTGPVTPVVEDEAFAAAALDVLPQMIDANAWSVWTEAVKASTGAKGKALFMPLRHILTGQERGPDMATLVPLIGRERIVRRMRGETA